MCHRVVSHKVVCHRECQRGGESVIGVSGWVIGCIERVGCIGWVVVPWRRCIECPVGGR